MDTLTDILIGVSMLEMNTRENNTEATFGGKGKRATEGEVEAEAPKKIRSVDDLFVDMSVGWDDGLDETADTYGGAKVEEGEEEKGEEDELFLKWSTA